MERRSLLSVLNPQLQALVEASLGETLAQSSSSSTATASSLQPSAVTTVSLTDTVTRARDGVTPMNEQETNDLQADQNGEKQVTPSATPSAKPSAAHDTVRRTGAPVSYKLDPSELFSRAYIPTLNSACVLRVCVISLPVHYVPTVLKHPSSPGFVVKENFLGSTDALALRDALLTLAETETFHEAKVGHGEHLRSAPVVRGDRIHWLKRPRDLRHAGESSNGLSPAILHLMKSVESLVYGVKSAVPSLNIRNVTSTQFAIFVRS